MTTKHHDIQTNKPTMRPLGVFVAIMRRELLLAWRKPSDLINPLFFFVVVATLFALAISPLPQVLVQIGPGVVWVATLLACLLPLAQLYTQDFDDGTMEQYLLSGQSLALICAARIFALWLLSAAPLSIAAVLIAGSYQMPAESSPILFLSLVFGSLTLCALGSVTAALTVGVQRASALIALLVLPLMVPVLIFGTRSVSLAVAGESASGPIFLLAAIALASLLLAPIAAAAALRISLE